MASSRICSVPGCDKKHFGLGFCRRHHTRLIRHGDPLMGGTPNGLPQKFIDDVASNYQGDDCLIWPFGLGRRGYGRVWVREGGRRKKLGAHVVVCEIAHGPRPMDKDVAAHSCGKGHEGCVNPRHLRWATHKENHADRLAHETSPRGERCGAAKLTEPNVREIRALSGQVSQNSLAARFGVTRGHINQIQKRRSWTWLE